VSDPHIALGAPGLAPEAWFAFALAHPDQAVAAPVPGTSSPPLPKLDGELRATVAKINDRVNQTVAPRPNDGTIMEPWRILDLDDMPEGDCHDYAVTKRALLIEAGLPPSCLLLAEAIAPETAPEHHMVLVVRTAAGDLVCDNLIQGMPPVWWVRNFEWLRVQTPADPNVWAAPAP